MGHRVRGRRDESYPILVVLICLLFLSLILGIFPSPEWMRVLLLATAALMAIWIAWAFVNNLHGKRRYLAPILALFLLMNSIAGQMNAPDWTHVVLIAFFVPVAVWVVWIVVKELRSARSG